MAAAQSQRWSDRQIALRRAHTELRQELRHHRNGRLPRTGKLNAFGHENGEVLVVVTQRLPSPQETLERSLRCAGSEALSKSGE